MPFAFAAILIRHVSFRKQHQGFGVEVHLFPFYCLVSDIFILLLKRCGRVPLEPCSFFFAPLFNADCGKRTGSRVSLSFLTNKSSRVEVACFFLRWAMLSFFFGGEWALAAHNPTRACHGGKDTNRKGNLLYLLKLACIYGVGRAYRCSVSKRI